jgi:hypothetical protein
MDRGELVQCAPLMLVVIGEGLLQALAVAVR